MAVPIHNGISFSAKVWGCCSYPFRLLIKRFVVFVCIVRCIDYHDNYTDCMKWGEQQEVRQMSGKDDYLQERL